jgi:hypothetical protein
MMKWDRGGAGGRGIDFEYFTYPNLPFIMIPNDPPPR